MFAQKTVLDDQPCTAACSYDAQFPGHVDNDIDSDGDDVTQYCMNVHTFVALCPDGGDGDHSDEGQRVSECMQ